MAFRVTPGASTDPISVEGEIDMAAADEFRQALAAAIERSSIHALDMSRVTFIDSSGLHALYTCAAAMDGTGPVTIRNPSTFVRRLMEIAGFSESSQIKIEDDG